MSDREAWKVWWCEEHLGLPLPDVDWCELGLRRYGTKTCRLVEMQLLPLPAASELLALKEKEHRSEVTNPSDIEQLREALGPPEMFGTFTEGNALIRRAARELLALKENGQTVWWCVEHESQGVPDITDDPCCWSWWEALGQENPDPARLTPCRMVKASLHIHREGT